MMIDYWMEAPEADVEQAAAGLIDNAAPAASTPKDVARGSQPR